MNSSSKEMQCMYRGDFFSCISYIILEETHFKSLEQ